MVADIYQGEPILDGRLAAPGSGGGLAATIPPGMRACAVKVDEVVGVAGFVTPGMRVDVLVSGDAPGNPDPREGTEVKTLLQNIQVLSAGTDIQKDAEGKPQQVHVVNLLVTPDQARNPEPGQQSHPDPAGAAQSSRYQDGQRGNDRDGQHFLGLDIAAEGGDRAYPACRPAAYHADHVRRSGKRRQTQRAKICTSRGERMRPTKTFQAAWRWPLILLMATAAQIPAQAQSSPRRR